MKSAILLLNKNCILLEVREDLKAEEKEKKRKKRKKQTKEVPFLEKRKSKGEERTKQENQKSK
jgi:hypothetical protein